MIPPTDNGHLKQELESTIQSTTHIKDEIDIDWDESDNFYGQTFDVKVQEECTAKVVLEELPESLLQKSIKREPNTGETGQPKFSERCSKCKKHFNIKNSFKRHKLYCGKQRNLQCAHCSYKTKFRKGLIDHLARIHANGKNIFENKNDDIRRFSRICQKCNKISDARRPTKCDRCFDELLYQCNKCATQFQTHSTLRSHYVKKCGVNGYFKCNNCDYKAVYRSAVVDHLKKFHKSPESSRELLGIEWISLRHVNEKEKFNTQQCPKCKKPMENSDKLMRHMNFCGGSERTNKSDMDSKSSKNVHHNVEFELTKCSICHKQFDNISTLNVHIPHCKRREQLAKVVDQSNIEVADTNEDRPYEILASPGDESISGYTDMVVRYCSRCHEDSAIDKNNWRFGRKMSCRKCETLLSYKCKKCLKDYATCSKLKIHLNSVCNPKSGFKCTKCSYKAYWPGQVKKHYYLVHRDANVACERCGKRLKSIQYLKKHLLVCGVEPKFQCDYCSCKFKNKMALKRHVFHNHMEPAVVDRYDMMKISRQRFARAKIHLKAFCSVRWYASDFCHDTTF